MMLSFHWEDLFLSPWRYRIVVQKLCD